MTDSASRDSSARGPAQRHAAHQILIDFGPVALFMLAYNIAHRFAADSAIYVATGVFMAATLAALCYARFVQKRTPPMLLITAAVVGVFGGLTIWLHNPVFIKMKPTVVNLLFAAAIFGGLLFRQNVWKILLQDSLDLPDRVWTTLAVRYGLLFIALAALNEIVWRNFSESFWANFKFFGVLGVNLAFGAANLPLVLKHMRTQETPENLKPD